MRVLQCCRLFGIAVVIAAAASTVAHSQTYEVLYNFGSKSGDPYNPVYSGIITQGRDGNLYSATENGGANDYGAIFKITPAGTLALLYSFDSTHGANPVGGLTLGTDGNFYGTTISGGSAFSGTVFKMTPSGSLTVLYNFGNGSDGGSPYAPPIEGTDGNFYGTAYAGGAGYGTVYKITPAGKFTSLYQFDITHGYGPRAPLVQGNDGSFYGTTLYGGPAELGVVFKITTAGKLTVLYNFDNTHGGYPVSGLIQGSDGNFYGTAGVGGSAGGGVVFKLTPAGKLTVLHNINDGKDGGDPSAGLVQASDGNFYSANTQQGSSNDGTLFEITPKGSFSVLYNFDGMHGSDPQVTLFQHTNGVVYGDTNTGGTGSVKPCAAGSCGVFYSWNDNLPAFVSLLPYSGKVGKVIEFLGQGFVKGKTTVSFNGTAATPTVVSSTYLTAAVPKGATTGSVTVTTSGVTLISNKQFRVTPVILSFSPTSGPVGTPVTITGTSFTGATKVTFGGVKATTFSVDSDTQITATVPTGAKTGKIQVMTPGGTATSPGVFTVTQ